MMAMKIQDAYRKLYYDVEGAMIVLQALEGATKHETAEEIERRARGIRNRLSEALKDANAVVNPWSA